MKTSRKSGYGNFGNLSKIYDKVRRDYPDEVTNMVLSFLPKYSRPKILDLGCGTGISTRRLLKKAPTAEIVGCDKDPTMLAVASGHEEKITYIECPAERLVFPDKSFDMITTFEALHWFNNPEALGEVRRVLRIGGNFAAINKFETGKFKTIVRETVASAVDKPLPDIRKDYDPEVSMLKASFTIVKKEKFKQVETYAVEEAIDRYRSKSISNLVPEQLKEKVESLIRGKFREISRDGLVEREVEIRIVIGRR